MAKRRKSLGAGLRLDPIGAFSIAEDNAISGRCPSARQFFYAGIDLASKDSAPWTEFEEAANASLKALAQSCICSGKLSGAPKRKKPKKK